MQLTKNFIYSIFKNFNFNMDIIFFIKIINYKCFGKNIINLIKVSLAFKVKHSFVLEIVLSRQFL